MFFTGKGNPFIKKIEQVKYVRVLLKVLTQVGATLSSKNECIFNICACFLNCLPRSVQPFHRKMKVVSISARVLKLLTQASATLSSKNESDFNICVCCWNCLPGLPRSVQPFVKNGSQFNVCVCFWKSLARSGQPFRQIMQPILILICSFWNLSPGSGNPSIYLCSYRIYYWTGSALIVGSKRCSSISWELFQFGVLGFLRTIVFTGLGEFNVQIYMSFLKCLPRQWQPFRQKDTAISIFASLRGEAPEARRPRCMRLDPKALGSIGFIQIAKFHIKAAQGIPNRGNVGKSITLISSNMFFIFHQNGLGAF